MSAHDRNLLKRADIERLKVWLDANDQSWRPGKGDYQLLQVKIGKGWGAVCTDAQGVITTPPELAPIIKLFKQGKPMVEEGRLLAEKDAQARNKQFLDDLRDDFAMAALPEVIRHFDTDGRLAWSHADIAKESYMLADAMLAERVKA